MIVFPNAKINIGLNIVNKRSDGYHDLETVFYPIMVKDALEVVESNELTFTSSGLAIPETSDSNICLKAFELLSTEMKLPQVHIHLHKNIPIGAGLGGGSSDASFFIKLMNEKFALGMSNDRMVSYAAQLGADCAFFIHNKPLFAAGKGDELEEIDLDLSKYFIVLIMADLHISTKEAFKDIIPKTPVKGIKDLIGNDIRTWRGAIVNDFEPGLIKRYPAIGQTKDSLYRSGAIYASMSGSGSSVYGIFESAIKLPELETNNTVYYGV